MDTVSPDSAMRRHALPIPLAWQATFWTIVAGEVLTAVLFAVGAVELGVRGI